MTYRFYGEVERLFVRREGCEIRLQNVSPSDAEMPKDGYFFLYREHENYRALYSLALLAASGRHRLSIRTVTDAVDTAPAEVEYMVLDW
jgi:hypothetical protein